MTSTVSNKHAKADLNETADEATTEGVLIGQRKLTEEVQEGVVPEAIQLSGHVNQMCVLLGNKLLLSRFRQVLSGSHCCWDGVEAIPTSILVLELIILKKRGPNGPTMTHICLRRFCCFCWVQYLRLEPDSRSSRGCLSQTNSKAPHK